jgi:hypothetical protein
MLTCDEMLPILLYLKSFFPYTPWLSILTEACEDKDSMCDHARKVITNHIKVWASGISKKRIHYCITNNGCPYYIHIPAHYDFGTRHIILRELMHGKKGGRFGWLPSTLENNDCPHLKNIRNSLFLACREVPHCKHLVTRCLSGFLVPADVILQVKETVLFDALKSYYD